MGGYFIVNGNEKVLRLTINPRRHYVSSTKAILLHQNTMFSSCQISVHSYIQFSAAYTYA